MTLDELKAQNADEPSEDSKVTIEPEQEKSEVQTEEVEEEASEPEKEEGKQEESETEDWMSEESNDSDNDESGFKPNPQAAAVRKKLRAKLHEKDDELESLKAKLEQYESNPPQVRQEKLPARPKLEDFDYDEAKHEEALDDWYDKRAEAKARQVMTSSQTEAQQREASDKQKQAIEQAVNSHYERAAKLVGEGKVSAEKYQTADRVVRESFERLAPKKGDVIVDNLIRTLNSLGEGSEKVMYQLGVNPAKMQEVANLFASDPSGLSTVAMLGKMQANITTPTKRKSSAPAPSKELKGDGSATPNAYLKKYKAAGGNIQKRIDVKREAKRNGVDTSEW